MLGNVKSTYELTRGVLRRYMADYTTTRNAPKTTKSGFFAILVKDTGEVWLGEAGNFTSVLSRFHSGQAVTQPACIQEAMKRGAGRELWLLTQPTRFSAQQLEAELIELNVLLDRKSPVHEGSGDLYIIRHDRSQDYFVITSRQTVPPEILLNSHLNRLSGQGRGINQALDKFVTAEATDILNKRGFTITHLCKFVDNDDKWLKRQLYINDCTYGTCLNLKGVDRVIT